MYTYPHTHSRRVPNVTKTDVTKNDHFFCKIFVREVASENARSAIRKCAKWHQKMREVSSENALKACCAFKTWVRKACDYPKITPESSNT